MSDEQQFADFKSLTKYRIPDEVLEQAAEDCTESMAIPNPQVGRLQKVTFVQTEEGWDIIRTDQGSEVPRLTDGKYSGYWIDRQIKFCFEDWHLSVIPYDRSIVGNGVPVTFRIVNGLLDSESIQVTT